MQASVSRETARSAPASMRVIDYAGPLAEPVWPKMKPMLAGALFLGLLGGVGLALLLDLLSGRVTKDRLARRADLPVYAMIEVNVLEGPRRAKFFAGQPPPNPFSRLQIERRVAAIAPPKWIEHDRRQT